MDRIVSVKQMRALDAYTIEHYTDSRELMYRAGRAVFESADFRGPVGIVCGSGNNAGDGYVLATILKENDIECELVLLSEKFSADGRYYYDRCIKMGIPCTGYHEDFSFSKYAMIVDCILGTGFKGSVSESLRSVIEKVNSSGAYVISVDINSGLNGDTGTGECYIISDLTVSIGFYKQGHFSGDADKAMKHKVNKDIGIRYVDGVS